MNTLQNYIKKRVVDFMWRGNRLKGKVIHRGNGLTVSVPRNPWSNIKDHYDISEGDVILPVREGLLNNHTNI